MRLFIGFVSVVFFLFIGSLFLLVGPNTYLSQLNISFWPKPLVRLFLDRKRGETISVMVDGREIQIKYADLGMDLDVDKTMKSLPDKWPAPSAITLVQPVFEFPEDLEKRISEKFPGRQIRNEIAEYDERSAQIVYRVEERKGRVDSVDLQVKLITFASTKKKPITIEMVNESDDLERRVNETNRKLKAVYKNPLEILFEDGKQKIILSSQELMNLLSVRTEDQYNTVNIDVDKEKLAQVLAGKPVQQSLAWTGKLIKDNLVLRYNGDNSGPVVLGADSGPNTNGSLADKYIEVDLSQQKMFFFENENLYKSYIVSTGLNYPTPVGNYKIKNKLPMGFSNIFHVWMPWWMAFDYREDIGAYLGIHELPYKLVDGEKVYRFGNYIGNRKTGGCIALSPGDSKEVFDRSFPGMDVVIYQ